MLPKRPQSQLLLLGALAVPGVESFLAGEVASLLGDKGRSAGVDEHAIKRLLVELAEVRAQRRSAGVSIETTRADLKSSLNKNSTRLMFEIHLQLDAIVDGTGEQIRGSDNAKAKGAAFDLEDAIELEKPIDPRLIEKLRELMGGRLS